MKNLNKLILISLFLTSKLSLHAQSMFSDTKCSILYCGYKANQVNFKLKIDTNNVKISGEDCEIKYETENMISVFIPMETMLKFKINETPSVILNVFDKNTDTLLDKKYFEIKRLTEYKLFIDESKENEKLVIVNGQLAIKSLDEGTTCNLPPLTPYIIGYEISINGSKRKMKGSGTTIQKKQLETIKKMKRKTSGGFRVTLTVYLNFDQQNKSKTEKDFYY